MKDGDEPGCLRHQLTAGLTAKSMRTSSTFVRCVFEP